MRGAAFKSIDRLGLDEAKPYELPGDIAANEPELAWLGRVAHKQIQETYRAGAKNKDKVYLDRQLSTIVKKFNGKKASDSIKRPDIVDGCGSFPAARDA